MKRSQKPTVNCPRCGKSVLWDEANRYRPFCSERCKLIDLGQWATEGYRIPEQQKKNNN
ncbi:MAG TPA: DNA gyrase inhibitor YacG [Burkholderiales bacterium]|nr:DNA gyrase inhibitor YacG [Burkholderiales bacterium]